MSPEQAYEIAKCGYAAVQELSSDIPTWNELHNGLQVAIVSICQIAFIAGADYERRLRSATESSEGEPE